MACHSKRFPYFTVQVSYIKYRYSYSKYISCSLMDDASPPCQQVDARLYWDAKHGSWPLQYLGPPVHCTIHWSAWHGDKDAQNMWTKSCLQCAAPPNVGSSSLASLAWAPITIALLIDSLQFLGAQQKNVKANTCLNSAIPRINNVITFNEHE